MDEQLRSLEQRLRATPDDIAALGELAQELARTGDARSAWRASARHDRLTGYLGGLATAAPRASRAPSITRELEMRGAWGVSFASDGEARLLSLTDGALVVHSRRGLGCVGLDGADRWGVEAHRRARAAVCGPDLLLADPGRLRLIDRDGRHVVDDVAAMVERRASWTCWVYGDRAVFWTWDRVGGGEVTLLDVGRDFGRQVDRFGFGPEDFGANPHAVAAGRVVAEVPGRGIASIGVAPLGSKAPDWQLETDAFFHCADARSVIVTREDGAEVVERELGTGIVRWSRRRPRPGQKAGSLSFGPGHVLSLSARLEVWEREQGATLWEAAGEDVLGGWIVGDVAYSLHALAGGAQLLARDLTTGVLRWRAPLPVSGSRAELIVGDGRLLIVLDRDEDDEDDEDEDEAARHGRAVVLISELAE